MRRFFKMYKAFFGMMLIGIAIWNWLDWYHESTEWWNHPAKPAILFFVSMIFGLIYAEYAPNKKEPDRL
jgi:hypothetical protein